MNNPRILITADTHFEDRGGRLAQGERTARWIEAEARRHRVDLIIHAGDVYETPRPSAATEAMVLGWFRRLAEIAPVVVLVGNHDRPRGGGGHALLPVAAALGLSDDDPMRDFLTDNELVVVSDFRTIEVRWAHRDPFFLHCIPYPERATVAGLTAGPEEAAFATSNALELMLASAAARTTAHPDAIHGIAFHGTLAGAAYSEWQTVPLTDAQVNAAPHWGAFHVHACGHLHRRQPAPGTGGLPGYVGAPNRYDFGDEFETPGISIVETTRDSDICGMVGERMWGASARFIANPDPRRYHTIPAHDLAEYASRLDEWLPFMDRHPEGYYRVTGTVDEALSKRVAEMVRAQRAKGINIRNATQVEAPIRTRVALSAPALGGDRAAIVEAVMRARGLDGDAAALLADVGEVWPT